MAKKTRKSSVSTILITTIFGGLLVFSIVLFMMISRLLNTGLESYFQEELENYSELILKEVKQEQDNIVKVQTNLLETLNSMYATLDGFTAEVVDPILDSTCRSFDVDDLAVFDVNGKPCSSSVAAKKQGSSDLVQKALRGETTVKYEKMGQDIKIVRGVPIKYGVKVVGALVGLDTVTSQQFVERMKPQTVIKVLLIIVMTSLNLAVVPWRQRPQKRMPDAVYAAKKS